MGGPRSEDRCSIKVVRANGSIFVCIPFENLLLGMVLLRHFGHSSLASTSILMMRPMLLFELRNQEPHNWTFDVQIAFPKGEGNSVHVKVVVDSHRDELVA